MNKYIVSLTPYPTEIEVEANSIQEALFLAKKEINFSVYESEVIEQ